MSRAKMTTRDWQEDLRHLADGLRETHRDPFHRIGEAEFDASVRLLDERIPSLAPHEVITELAALVASIGDGHTALRLDELDAFHRFSIAIEHFSDGLFVTAIDRHHAHLAGTRVLAIDGVAAAEVIARLRPLVSRDNDMGVLATAPRLLSIPEVLHARGIIADLETATFTVSTKSTETVVLHRQAGRAEPGELADARAGAEAPTPLWLRERDDNWFAVVPDQDAIYVGYNSVRDSDGESLAGFFDRLFATVEREAAGRLILDLRQNRGGNNMLNLPLVHHLIRSDRIDRWGSLFAIIGRHTFSAAMNLAVDLEKHTRVLFVGEPTGSSPNHFGENGSVTLPHSGLHVSVSILWWQHSLPYDTRPWITPEIPAPLSSTDWLGNRDPCVDAALAYGAGSGLELAYPDRVMRHFVGRLPHDQHYDR